MSKIDYDLTKIKAFVFDVDGVLSSSVQQMDEEGMPIRTCNVKDGLAIRIAVLAGFKIAIITGGRAENVKKRYHFLGISEVITDCPVKLPVFLQWLKDNSLNPDEVAFMGDDIPDLKCMRAAGLAAAPCDASWEARQTASFISKFSGGYGCVRDLIEQTLRAQNLWPDNIDSWIPDAP